jgi:hypothetical protein
MCVVAALAGVAMLLAGCLKAPVGDPEKSRVDGSLVGCWLSAPDAVEQSLLCFTKYDSRTYLATYFSFTTSAAGEIEPDQQWPLKAWLTEIKGTRLMCGEIIGSWWDIKPEDPRFMVAAVQVVDGRLELKIVDHEFGGLKDLTASDKIAAFIGDNLEKAELWKPVERRTRVAPDSPQLKAILTAFHLD